jgi:serine/threonine protein kinase
MFSFYLTSRGYIPPEFIGEGSVSRMSDVFAFGVVIRETIANACTQAKSSGKHLSAEEWVSNVFTGILQHQLHSYVWGR